MSLSGSSASLLLPPAEPLRRLAADQQAGKAGDRQPKAGGPADAAMPRAGARPANRSRLPAVGAPLGRHELVEQREQRDADYNSEDARRDRPGRLPQLAVHRAQLRVEDQ